MGKKRERGVEMLTDRELGVSESRMIPADLKTTLNQTQVRDVARIALGLQVGEIDGRPITMAEKITLAVLKQYSEMAGEEDDNGKPRVTIRDLKAISELAGEWPKGKPGRKKGDGDSELSEAEIAEYDAYMES